jgi:RNA polymerase sigma-70 factor (ECF subfamily)
MPDLSQRPEGAGLRVFATTHWSVVLAAGQTNTAQLENESAEAQAALETLCRGYWYPIYVYVRRNGYGLEEAQDLTQEFFAQLIAKRQFRLADRSKGKFRTFLLAMLDYFLAREWKRAHRQKRGGQFTFVSIDEQSPEERYLLEPADHDSPERIFLREWAVMTLKHTIHALETECERSGKALLFAEVKNLLSGEHETVTYAQIGQRLGMNEGAVRVAVHRLRQRYGELLRQEVARTVASEAEIDEELKFLVHVLSQ